jgi:hypothetical protein
MRLFLSVFIVLIISVVLIFPVQLFSVNSSDDGISVVVQEPQFHFTTMKNDTGGWYYQVLKGDKRFIIQKHIPAIQGVFAFSDSIQAAKVANLMCRKLDQGLFPPSISVQEIDSLKIIYKKQF